MTSVINAIHDAKESIAVQSTNGYRDSSPIGNLG